MTFYLSVMNRENWIKREKNESGEITSLQPILTTSNRFLKGVNVVVQLCIGTQNYVLSSSMIYLRCIPNMYLVLCIFLLIYLTNTIKLNSNKKIKEPSTDIDCINSWNWETENVNYTAIPSRSSSWSNRWILTQSTPNWTTCFIKFEIAHK